MNAKLLAPAGSFAAMKAAFAAGADECYIGGAKFGARAYADNLDETQMQEAIDYAHMHGKKLYLTVNTLLKEEELEEELYDYLKPFYEQGLDAVIIQDIGALQLIREAFPDLAVHASTQMTVTGPAAASMLEGMGVSRIVTPRELSLTEISRIRKNTNLEIESFVHGALCYCYSGQCLFSSMLGGRSGNRGRCAQPCRLPYNLYEEEKQLNVGDEQYLLSPKDMCTVTILPDIIKAGVTSLKIEGRMKKPEYTAGVVRIYRKYLDILSAGKGEFKVTKTDQQELMDLYNRDGFNQSYFQVRNGREMMALKNKKKDAAGKDISKSRNEALFSEIRSQYVEKADPIAAHAKVFLKKNCSAVMEVSCLEHAVRVSSGMVEEAGNQPLSQERIRQQLMKTGNTPFYFSRLEIEMDDGIFMPMKLLNELRRNALEQLQQQIVQKYRRSGSERPDRPKSQNKEKPDGEMKITVLADTREQLRAACETGQIEAVYCNCSIFDKKNFTSDLLSWLRKFSKADTKVFLSLPYVVRESEMDALLKSFPELIEQGLKGFLVHSLEGYAVLKGIKLEQYAVMDYQIYTMNERTRMFWKKQGILYDTITPELNEKELRQRTNGESEMIIYGYTLMMISAQCLRKNTGKCTRSSQPVWLQDRYLKKFYIKCECDFCYNVIYNSIPLGLLKESGQVKRLGCHSLRLSFSLEDFSETKRIIQLFQDVYLKGADYPGGEIFTKGHFKRGVE